MIIHGVPATGMLLISALLPRLLTKRCCGHPVNTKQTPNYIIDFNWVFKSLHHLTRMQKHTLNIGTSGWLYKHWLGTFYPEGTKSKDQFPYYIKHFNTVELNNTFYRLPEKTTFQKWEKEVPDDFIYVVKASRYITHMKKLHNPEQSTALFLENVSILGEKLGAILFQLPPFMKANLSLLNAFLEQLPKTYRYVFEFRNADWYQEEVYHILKKHNCAFCIYELDGHLSPLEITADFVYLRLHGPGKKYQGSYSDTTLKTWAQRCKKWLSTKDVFIYFDNDENGYAAFNAIKLKELINDNPPLKIP